MLKKRFIAVLFGLLITGRHVAPSTLPAQGKFKPFFNELNLSGKNWKSTAVITADLDGNHFMDAVIANGYNQVNQVWLNDGHGHPTLTGQEFAPASSFALAPGDLDGDQDVDLFVVTNDNQPDQVWMNDGKGHFVARNLKIGNSWGLGAALADIDGDGDRDAWVATGQNQPDEVWLNDGKGHFQQSPQKIGQEDNFQVVLTDLDGDQKADAVVTGFRDDPSYIYWNDGQGIFTRDKTSLGAGQGLGAATADLDGNKSIDIVLTQGASSPPLIWLNQGKRTFVPGPTLEPCRSYAVAIADMDGDQQPDLVFSGIDAYPGTVWLNQGQGTFRPLRQKLNIPGATGIALADFDGNGRTDVIITSYQKTPTTIFFNGQNPAQTLVAVRTGQGIWKKDVQAKTWHQMIKINPAAVMPGDFSGTGSPDLALWQELSATKGGNGLWIMTWPGLRWSAPLIRSREKLKCGASGDLDGDGRADILISLESGLWLKNSHAGDWQRLQAPGPEAMTCADFDNDNRDEILAAWDRLGGIWLYNHPSGWGKRILAGKNCQALAAADFTGDGIIDWAGSWPKGVYYVNSVTQKWTKIHNEPASILITSDLDGDGYSDLSGTWKNYPGIWSRNSKDSRWQKLFPDTPVAIAAWEKDQ